MLFVASIPPRVSFPVMYPDYLDQVQHCNFILRNLVEVEQTISFFKLRGLFEPGSYVYVGDGIHLKAVSCSQGCGLFGP